MDSYCQYEDLLNREDLSLFNGDLLLEPLPSEYVDQPIQDGQISKAFDTKVLAQEVLRHAQYGSCELGLEDLLVESPTKDLPDPFSSTGAWMDTQTDILHLLTSGRNIEESFNESQPSIQTIENCSNVESNPTVVLEATENINSLEVLDNYLLLTDNVTEDSINTADVNDMLLQLNESGLEELLSSELDASVSDASILSPVSAIDIESILSSPPSPESCVPSIFDVIDNSQMPLSEDVIESDTNIAIHEQDKPRTASYTKISGRKSRNIDRKERKKEQNRTAALRYRQKKREEDGTVYSEYNQLKEKNDKLKDHVDSLSKEIRYLKDLMAEVYNVKNKGKK